MQYASNVYVERLESRGVAISMSRPANPYDNAKAESFMKTLKAEEVNGAIYLDLEDAKRHIGAFIETVYNAKRLHSALGYKPPEEFEAETQAGRKPTNAQPTLVTELACLRRRGQSSLNDKQKLRIDGRVTVKSYDDRQGVSRGIQRATFAQ